MTNLQPIPETNIGASVWKSGYMLRRTENAIQQMNNRAATNIARQRANTLARLAKVQGEGMVATEKVHETTRVGRAAMNDISMLHHYTAIVAAGDPMLAAELSQIAATVQLGAVEMITDLIDTFRREGLGL